MATEHFKASSQYEDLRGTVAADRADTGTIERWLESQGALQDGERLVGTSMHFAQLPASGESHVSIFFFVVPTDTNLDIRIPGAEVAPTVVVRRIHKELPLATFMQFFKRLELTLSSEGEFEGRSYTYVG